VTTKDWENVLVEATEKVRAKVSTVAEQGDRALTVGVGASGDKTILADREAEEILLDALLRMDGIRVLSEEAGASGDAKARTLAVVDPLDGSSNFERGIPFYCTSVAMVDGESLADVKFGIVRDLVSGDVYIASRGGGAKKNGRAIMTSRVSKPSEAVVGIDMSRSSPSVVSRLTPLVIGVKRQVHLGANALELCYLADGRIDAFVDIRGKIRITDFAAAYLVASEAGAVFTDSEGGELEPKFDLHARFGFVGSGNKIIHKEILQLCGKSGGSR
jgi:myo-inositol-1(or 4)-monophosphatase